MLFVSATVTLSQQVHLPNIALLSVSRLISLLVDVKIIEGTVDVDQSPLTGESLLIAKSEAEGQNEVPRAPTFRPSLLTIDVYRFTVVQSSVVVSVLRM